GGPPGRAPDFRVRPDQGVTAAVPRLCLFEAIGVAFLIAEAQGIERRLAQLDLRVSALVEQQGEAALGIETQMVPAIAADEQVRLELAMKQHLLAARAFVP